MKKLLALFFIFSLQACSTNETESSVYTKSKSVEDLLSRNIKKPWSLTDSDGSDLALINVSTKSFFLFNSACRKYEASNLNTLTASILSGINDVEYFQKSNVIHQERQASLVVAKGSIDGVSRFFKILTTQKNNCIYDFALISTTKKNLDRDTVDFNNFIQLLKLN